MDPYRTPAPAPPIDPLPCRERWKLHPYVHVAAAECRWCTRHGVNRHRRCHGVRSWLGLGPLLCPRTPHHHARCGFCGRDWIEETCDEAPAAPKPPPHSLSEYAATYDGVIRTGVGGGGGP